MSNMSYCRFQNTLDDLRDCSKSLHCEDELSKEEKRACISLLKLCRQLADNFTNEDGEVTL